MSGIEGKGVYVTCWTCFQQEKQLGKLTLRTLGPRLSLNSRHSEWDEGVLLSFVQAQSGERKAVCVFHKRHKSSSEKYGSEPGGDADRPASAIQPYSSLCTASATRCSVYVGRGDVEIC
eukprot:2824044-Pleurochrysis_carterae.AAC.1